MRVQPQCQHQWKLIRKSSAQTRVLERDQVLPVLRRCLGLRHAFTGSSRDVVFYSVLDPRDLLGLCRLECYGKGGRELSSKPFIFPPSSVSGNFPLSVV